MEEVHANTSGRIALLYTRYPVASETFLQREAEALHDLGLDFEILSLWPAPGKNACPVPPSHVLQPWHLLSLFLWIPYWLLKCPRGMGRIATALLESRRANLINFWETMLGMGYAIIHARSLNKRHLHLHAVWSSAPATAAWAVNTLTGLSFSMAGHAYDLFEDGGDGLLEIKMPASCFFRTSTEAGRQRWTELGAQPERIHVIRRGLLRFPILEDKRITGRPLRLLAVGRLVEKMGFDLLLQVLHELKRIGFSFEAVLVGGGPLRGVLEKRVAALGLSGVVTFTGPLRYPEVEEHYRWADMLLFGGQIAQSGDRAGFPNVIGEAMAWGIPVCATPVGAVMEGIRDGETGLIFSDATEAARKIVQLANSPESYEAICQAARQWVEAEFDAMRNMETFKDLLNSLA